MDSGENSGFEFVPFSTSTPGQKMNFGGGGKSPLERALMNIWLQEEMARKGREQEIEMQRLQNEQKLSALGRVFQSKF